MGVFFRVPWASEVPEEQLDAWFGLIAKGRAEGPTSPYYVNELGLQQVASGVWPPKNKDKPGVMYTEELKKIAKYFPHFDKVYVGTLLFPGEHNASFYADYAAHQRTVAQQFLEEYPLSQHPNLAWYITDEGCIESPAALTQLVQLSAPALDSVAPLPVLWSPAICTPFASLPDNGTQLEKDLETLFCSPNMTVPVAIHFQDHNGCSASFTFPFYYDYGLTSADGLAYYNVLKRVSAKCPMLREVKINMEMFVEHLNPEGEGGEDNGAFILDGDPREVGLRKRTYEANAEIGVSWALPHWYNLNTYANRTMDFQCTEEQLKSNNCSHPYLAVPVSALSSRYSTN